VGVLVRDQPEAADNHLIGQDADQCGIAVAHKAGQNADAARCRQDAMLGKDRCGAQISNQIGVDLGQIIEFGRIDQFRDIADELMARFQIPV
jgi:hypothetical protein